MFIINVFPPITRYTSVSQKFIDNYNSVIGKLMSYSKILLVNPLLKLPDL